MTRAASCAACAADLAETDKYCASCGSDLALGLMPRAAVDMLVAVKEPQPEAVTPDAKTPGAAVGLRSVAWIVGAVVALLTVVALWLTHTKPGSKAPAGEAVAARAVAAPAPTPLVASAPVPVQPAEAVPPATVPIDLAAPATALIPESEPARAARSEPEPSVAQAPTPAQAPVAAAQTPSPATSPGFACAQASSVAEQLVCAHADLGEADHRLNLAYHAAQARAWDATPLRQEQRKWLRQRDACTDANCVRQAYAQREAVLVGASR